MTKPIDLHIINAKNEYKKAINHAFDLGWDANQERIIKLLEDYDFSTIWRQVEWNPDAWESFGSDDLIALIKGND